MEKASVWKRIKEDTDVFVLGIGAGFLSFFFFLILIAHTVGDGDMTLKEYQYSWIWKCDQFSDYRTVEACLELIPKTVEYRE